MADPDLHDWPGDEEPAIVTSTDRARQGVTGHGLHYVLIFGMAGAVIAFVWLAMVYAAK
jgi:uncharacterized membrane protein